MQWERERTMDGTQSALCSAGWHGCWLLVVTLSLCRCCCWRCSNQGPVVALLLLWAVAVVAAAALAPASVVPARLEEPSLNGGRALDARRPWECPSSTTTRARSINAANSNQLRQSKPTMPQMWYHCHCYQLCHSPCINIKNPLASGCFNANVGHKICTVKEQRLAPQSQPVVP